MQRFTVTGCDVELAIRQGWGPALEECGVVSFAPPVIQILIRPRCQDLRNQQFEICGRLLPLGSGEKKPMPAGGALALEDVLRILKNGYPRTTATMVDLYGAYSLGKEVAEEEVMRLREENTTLKAQLLTGDPGTPVGVPEPVIVGPAGPPVATQVKNHWGLFSGETPMGCPPLTSQEGEE